MYNYNLAVERQLGADWMVRLAYVGSHASHLLETIELSPSVYIAGSTLSTDQRRLYSQFTSIAQASNDINSNYNSMQLTVQKRFAKGLTFQANYTWSKSLDDIPSGQSASTVVSGGSSPIPWYMPGRHQFDYGPSDFDHTHRVVANFVSSLPNAPAFVRYTVGGWDLSGLLSA